MDSSTPSFIPPQKNSASQKKPVVLVTGASGLIGRRILHTLAEDYECVGLDKSGNPHADIRTENICFDITDKASIKAALGRVAYTYGHDIASVIHLAAYYDFSGKPSPLYDRVTVKGTADFLTALQQLKVRQFVFSSTNLVYKPSEPGERINEDWPVDPTWEYPESKVKTEKVIHEKRGDIPVVILRVAGGYDEEGHSIPISNQIQRIYEKQLTSYFFPGDLLHGNAFVHFNDLDNALASVVEKRDELPPDITINISEPKTYSYEELQNTIGELIHGEAWHTYEIPKPLAKAGAWAQDLVGDSFIKPWMVDRADDHYEMDISLAKKYLDWYPVRDLKSTLPEIIAKLKADPEKWYTKNKLAT